MGEELRTNSIQYSNVAHLMITVKSQTVPMIREVGLGKKKKAHIYLSCCKILVMLQHC